MTSSAAVRTVAPQLAMLLFAVALVQAPRVLPSFATPLFAPAQGYLDFDYGYYPAAQAVRVDPGHLYRGATYDTERGTGVLGAPASFVNLPVVAWLFVPLTVLPLPEAGQLLLALNIAIVLVSLWLLQQRLAHLGALARWAVTLAFVSSGPLMNALNLGQTTPLVLLLLLLAERHLHDGRHTYAGLCLGLACLIKIPPLLLLPYFALRRRWRVLTAATSVLALAVAVSLAVYGGPLHRTYFDVVIRANAGTALAAHNCQSIDALLMRLLSDVSLWSWQPIPLGGGIRLLHWTLLLALAAVTVWLLTSARERAAERTQLELGLVMCFALAVLPVSWVHYGAWLLPVFVAVGGGLRCLPAAQARTLGLLLVLAVLLINFPMPSPAIIRRFDHAMWFRLAISHQLCGTLLLFGLCGWSLRR